MLLAKISPNAVIVNQTTPFNYTSNAAFYMQIVVSNYIPESTETLFILNFGNTNIATSPDEPAPEPFTIMYSYNLPLANHYLQNWGTDDKDLFNIIADILGVTIEEYVSIP